MLRITRIDKNGSTLLKLEGKLLSAWTGELLAETSAAPKTQISLDLSHVSFVDAAGLATLRDLARRGVVIGACSNFVAELLHAEKP